MFNCKSLPEQKRKCVNKQLLCIAKEKKPWALSKLYGMDTHGFVSSQVSKLTPGQTPPNAGS